MNKLCRRWSFFAKAVLLYTLVLLDAKVAQLVERVPSKLAVVGSIPSFRSKFVLMEIDYEVNDDIDFYALGLAEREKMLQGK